MKSPVDGITPLDLKMLIQGFEAMSKGEHSIRSRQLWAACVELSARRETGMVLVPVEPTREMLEAGMKTALGFTNHIHDIYRAMLAARPT